MTTTGIAVATCPMTGGRMRGSRSLLLGQNRGQRGGKAFAFRRGRKREKTPSSPSPGFIALEGLADTGRPKCPWVQRLEDASGATPLGSRERNSEKRLSAGWIPAMVI